MPNSGSNTVDEIDPRTYKVVRHFPVGIQPQHVVPSYDLKTLYVASDIGNSLQAVDPVTGKDFTRDPRHIARKAEAYLKESGAADTVDPFAGSYFVESLTATTLLVWSFSSWGIRRKASSSLGLEPGQPASM